MNALLLTLALAAAPQGSPDPDPVVLLVRGYGEDLEVHRSVLRDWLVRMHGEPMSGRFAQMSRAHTDCVEQGIAPAREEVEREVESQIAARTAAAFRGDASQWVAELERAGRTPEGYRMERRVQVRYDLECAALVRQGRDYGPEALRAEWERVHGRFGARFEARTLGLRFIQPTPPAGVGAEETARLRDAARAELEARARKLTAELRAGASFEEYLERHATDPRTIAAGHRFEEGFPPATWPEEAWAALRDAQPGDILDPVYARGAFHVVRIESRQDTPYSAELEPELARSLRASKPTAGEMMALVGDLGRRTQVEVLPAMNARGPRPADEVVMRADGRDVTRRELGDWLLRLLGERELRTAAQVLLIDRRARELGFEITDEDARERILADAELLIDRLYSGDRDRWWRNYRDQYPDEEAWIRRMTPVNAHFLQAEEVLRTERVVTEEQVRAHWQRVYGLGGRLLDLRVVRVDVVVPEGELGVQIPREELERRSREAWKAAVERAAEARSRLEEGEDFAAVARRYSDDEETAARGGELGERIDLYGLAQSVVDALTVAVKGDLVGPVEDRQYSKVWLFEVRDVADKPYEDVAEELRQELLTARPTESERATWLNVSLRDIELLPAPALYSD